MHFFWQLPIATPNTLSMIKQSYLKEQLIQKRGKPLSRLLRRFYGARIPTHTSYEQKILQNPHRYNGQIAEAALSTPFAAQRLPLKRRK